MSQANTSTSTYTSADINKVVDNFAADFSMMGQSTGLWTRQEISDLVTDLRIFATNKLLLRVSVLLKDEDGNELKAAVYRVETSATGWRADRPGDALWPKAEGGILKVIVGLSADWDEKTDAQRQGYGLIGSWPVTTEDTSFPGLTRSTGQQYSSRGYGWERDNYT